MSATEALVALCATPFDELPTATHDPALASIRDVLGVAIYGSSHPVGDRIADYVASAAPGEGATLLGRGTASAPGAALANGCFAHAIDYDDTFESMVLHPSAPVFPAALAAAEMTAASGRALVGAYIIGVEAAYRVGHSIYPSHYDQGWHLTGTAGTFGATAAAAALYELSATETAHAFGIAASGSSAMKKNFGSMTKPLHPGHAAQTGLRAVLLAAEGFTADPEIMDGPMGYGMVMSPDGSYDPTPILEGRDHWGVLDLGFKPYPSGVISHAAMEATRRLVATHELTHNDVTSVTVTLDEAASEMLIHATPENELQAKFSIEFCLAVVLRAGDAGVAHFTDEYVTDLATQAIIKRVERAFEPSLFNEKFAGYGARVSLETTAGEKHTAEERRAPGSPSNPLPEARWEAKFADCITPVLGEEAPDRLLAVLEGLLEADSVEPLCVATRPV